MVRVQFVGNKKILDVYPNDAYQEILAKVEEIGNICSKATCDYLRANLPSGAGRAVAELTVDFTCFQKCGGELRLHRTIVLDSPYITIDTAQEYIAFVAKIID